MKLVFLFIFFSPTLLLGETDYDYGVYLYRTGNYQASIFELERFTYYNPDNFYTPYAQFLTALSYANKSQYSRALSHLRGIEQTVEKSPHRDLYSKLLYEAEFHILNILFRQKQFIDFQVQRENILYNQTDMDDDIKGYIDSMSVAVSIYNMQWDEALGNLEKSEYIQGDVRNQLEEGLKTTLEHTEKSPVIGGLFSLIPGFGHMYAGRVMDGMRSLLLNATFISLTVFSFKENMNVLGGVFLAVEGVLYISNIYGGVNAVLQENARYAIERRDTLLKSIYIPPLDILTIREEFDF